MNMKNEHRNERANHHGGLLPPIVEARWGLAAGRAPAVRDENAVMPRTSPDARYRSLLVPVNGAPFGEHALPHALGIARRAGAEVRVVHVHCPLQSAYRPETLYYDSGLDWLLKRRQQAYLNDLVRRLRKVTTVPVTPVYREGREVAASLLEASAGTDLVVMATHGRGPLGRLWSGSVADALMRQLSVPLLLVRGHHAPADLTGDPLVRRVLVPLDGSEYSEQVLGPAAALGALTNADHTLLRVLRPATAGSSAEQAEAWSYLRRVADRLEKGKRPAHPCLVLNEEPAARAILRYARSHDADLIALATRARGGVARLLRGSVADQVVRGAAVPVLVFRPEPELAPAAAIRHPKETAS